MKEPNTETNTPINPMAGKGDFQITKEGAGEVLARMLRVQIKHAQATQELIYRRRKAGAIMRELRVTAGVTVEQVAGVIGMNPAHIQAREDGTEFYDFITAQAVIAVLVTWGQEV